jgi:hypothetical protein
MTDDDSVISFRDGYADKPTAPRAALEFEIERLRVLSWADPGDAELRAQIEQLKAKLHALDHGKGSDAA